MFEVMDSLGHQRFFLAGHDRGARVSHRMCLDHPDRIMKVCILDVLPAYYTWTNLNIKSARLRQEQASAMEFRADFMLRLVHV